MGAKILSLLLCVLFLDNSVRGDLPLGCHISSQEMICKGKNVTQLPVDIPYNVVSLLIDNASIVTLDTHYGTKIGQLMSLTVQNSEVAEISDDFFDKIADRNNQVLLLKNISLNRNQLTNLKEGIFQSASYVQKLSLSNNNLTSIRGVFKGMIDLVQLNLEGNKLTDISGADFYDLVNLIHLDLNSNQIKTIGPDVFSRNPDLKSLHLSGNSLDEHNLSLGYLTLHNLDMAKCQLTKIPGDLPGTLHVLNLSYNNITKISATDFENCSKSLRDISLAHNDIEDIPRGTFDTLKSLERLYLFGNRLRKIPGPFPNNIRFIRLDNNSIDTMRTDHFHWIGPYTLHLNLDNNNITQVTDNLFTNNIHINSLTLSGNPIRVLADDMFSNAKSLFHLDLSRLKLNEIQEKSLSGLEKVSMLFMSHVDVPEDKVGHDIFKHVNPLVLLLDESPFLAKNFLKSLTAEGRFFTGLKHLHLRNNNLTTFTADLQKKIPNLAEISFAGNSFNCTEDLSWLQQWYLSKPHIFVDINHAKCRWPNILKDLELVIVFKMNLIKTVWKIEPVNNTTPVPTEYQHIYDYYDIDIDYDKFDYNYYYDSSIYNAQQTSKHWNKLETANLTTKTIHLADPSTTTQGKSQIENAKITEFVAMETDTPTTPETVFHPTTSIASMADINEKPKKSIPHQENESVSPKSVGIAISMSFGVILFMLVVAFIVYKVFSQRPTSAQQNGHPAASLDYVFIAARADKPEPKVHRKLSRTERGSTTSHANEDITNDVDTHMKVYTLDMDD